MTPFFRHLVIKSNLVLPNAIIKPFLMLLLACTVYPNFAQGPSWVSGTYYPTSPDRQEESEFVLATSDGGSLLVGSFEYGAGDWDGRIVKLNSNGTIAWEQKPGGAGLDYLYSACEFSDGYIMVGKKTVNGNFRMWAIKYSLTGALIWDLTYTSNYAGNSFGGMTVIKSLGNRAIIGGYRAGFIVPQPFPTPPSSAGHLWVLEPSNGVVFQDKPTDGYITYKMELKPDQSGYYAFGETFDGSEGGCYIGEQGGASFSPTGPYSGYYSDIIVSTLDLSTNLVDSWTYGGETNDIFIDAMATADNGFAILARTSCTSVSGNTGPNNVGLHEWLLKGSEFGDLEWVLPIGLHIIDAEITPFGLTSSCDNKIVVGLDGGFYSPTPSNVILYKYDLNGTQVWTEGKGFTNPFFTGSYITTSPSGAYLVLSDATSPNNDEDFYLHRWSVDPACSPVDFCSKAVTVSCGQFLSNQTTVGAGNSIMNYSCISGTTFSGSDKVYKITLSQTSDLQVGLEILQANLDLDLFLLSNNCTTVTCLDWSTKPNVANGNNPYTNKEGIAKSLSAGTYYIVVDGYNATQQGGFNIDFACGKLNCASATTLVCGTPYSSNTSSGSNNVSIYNLTAGLEDDLPAATNDPAKLLDVNNAGPERIHQFTINQQSTVSITLSGVSANIDLELFLLNTNCVSKTCIAKSTKPAGQNETISTLLNPATYYVVVDGFQNYSGAYTLTVNCGNCPPPANNFNCDIVKCNYSGTGSNLQYTFIANQGIAPGYNWKITGNNLNVTGGTGTSYTYNFANPGTYQVCYPYLNFNGCVEYCCINVCVLNPLDCDGSIAPSFDANANGWKFKLQGNGNSNIEWRDDDTGQTYGNSVLSNLIPVPSPCNSGVAKTVSVSYFDGSCYRVCCFRYYPCNPFDCGLITYAYDANAAGYRFELNTIGGFDQNTIVWTVDSPVNQSLGAGSFQSNLLPLPVNCAEYWVSVRFKDGLGIWKVCCIKIYVCNPFNCFDFGYNYVPANNGYQFVLNQNGATNIAWTLDDTGGSLGTGATSSILPIPGTCIQRTVTVRYYWNGVWYICCRKLWLCNNPFDCLDFTYNYVPASNGYQFALNQNGATNISWTLDNNGSSLGTGSTSSILPIPSGNCIERIVTVRYFWNGAWYICCRKLILCNNPFECLDFAYNYVPASSGYQFALNQNGATNISWTLDDTGGSLGAGATSSILPIPPGNCIERTVTVRYYWNGAWYICCRKLWLCNNPFDCLDFTYNFVPSSNGYQFALNQNGATNISWTLDNNGSSLGTGSTSSILPIPSGNCIERTVTVRYFWNGAWYICCRKLILCNNPFDCLDFAYNYVPASSGYQFALNQNGATNISWTLDDTGGSLGAGATSSILPIPPGNCIQRTVTVRYYWNGAWYICCRKLILCNNPFDCLDFAYNYVPASSGYQFALNQNGATNISWTLDNNGSSLGTGSTSSILPIPPGNCIERTVTVRYYWNGAWYICCRKLTLCNNPFDCQDFAYNYVPASSGYQFALNQNGATNISWTLDDTGGSLGAGTTSSILPIPPGNCIQRTVTVRYYWNGAWYICCRKMVLCNNPLNCVDFVYNYIPANNGYQFVLNQNGATNISWTLDETGVSIGTGTTSSILPIPGNCTISTITVRYFWNGVWYICCRKIWLCNPNACATEINHSWQNNNLLTLSTNSGYQSVVWRLENGLLLGNGNNISIANPGSNAVICVYYLDLDNVWRVCCKTVNSPPNPAIDLTFDIDDNICASSNTIVDVPIRVRNFNNVLSFEMSVKSLNGSLAQFVSITPGVLNGSGLFQVLDPSTGVLSWFNATPVSVPDNSIACTLRVNLTGVSGASGLIEFANTPTSISAEQVVNGSQTVVSPLLIGGSVCITSNISISGKITREDNVGVGNATVQLTGSSTQTTTTDAQGNYSFNGVASGGNYIITPVKDIGDKNGVTGGDLVAIQRHILSIAPLGSPYKRIAADANNTQTISGGDLVSIQRLILSLDPTLLANQSWRFVDKSWIFSNPSTPWTTPFPEKITINNASNNINNADFTGIKIADVNLSNNPNMFGNQNVDDRDASLVLETKYLLEEQNGKVSYPVTVAADCDLESIQFTLVYDHHALTFRGVRSNVLPGFSDNNFGLPIKDQGVVTIVWATTSGDPILLKEGEEILWLEFDYHDNNLRPQDYDLKLLSDPTEAIATTLGGSSKQLELRNLSRASNHFSHRAYPNPFSNKGVLLIELPDEDDLDIAIYNSNGQRVFINTGHFNSGVHAVSFECAGCKDTQMLYYQIRGAHFTGYGKVMFVKQ